MDTVSVKSVSGPVSTGGVRAAGDCTEAIAEIRFQASTDAHSTCMCFGPWVLSHSSAE